jgi:hypothetical protein
MEYTQDPVMRDSLAQAVREMGETGAIEIVEFEIRAYAAGSFWSQMLKTDGNQ